MKGKATHKNTLRWETWIRPGKEQTLQDIIDRFQGRILRVDETRGEVLVDVTEVEYG